MRFEHHHAGVERASGLPAIAARVLAICQSLEDRGPRSSRVGSTAGPEASVFTGPAAPSSSISTPSSILALVLLPGVGFSVDAGLPSIRFKALSRCTFAASPSFTCPLAAAAYTTRFSAKFRLKFRLKL